MSIQGEANEFLNLLFGDMNEKRFAQVIKVKYTIRFQITLNFSFLRLILN